MDSARPIAQRTAGEQRLDTGSTFTAAMWTTFAENTLTTFGFAPDAGRDRPGGYRRHHRRSYGEGPAA